MARTLTCRYCKQKFIANPEEENVTWMMRSQGWYYHTECWESFINKEKERNSDEWYDLLIEFITHDLKKPYNYYMTRKQYDNFLAEGKTGKGIYFTAYYTWFIKKAQYDEKYGIGLIRVTYDESIEYWTEQEKIKAGIMAELEKIQRERAAKGRSIKRTERKKKEVSLEDIMAELEQ